MVAIQNSVSVSIIMSSVIRQRNKYIMQLIDAILLVAVVGTL